MVEGKANPCVVLEGDVLIRQASRQGKRTKQSKIEKENEKGRRKHDQEKKLAGQK